MLLSVAGAELIQFKSKFYFQIKIIIIYAIRDILNHELFSFVSVTLGQKLRKRFVQTAEEEVTTKL